MARFDDRVDHFDSLRETEWGRRTIDSFLDFVVPDPAWRALDVGCGAGNQAMALAARVAEVVGVDQSPKMVERAAEKCRVSGVGNCEFMVGDATALPFEEGSFDLITTSALLYLVDEGQAESAAEFARVVRPGGTIALHEPTSGMTPETMEAYIRRARERGEDVADISGWAKAAISHHPFTEESLEALFTPHGLRLVESRRILDGLALEAKLG